MESLPCAKASVAKLSNAPVRKHVPVVLFIIPELLIGKTSFNAAHSHLSQVSLLIMTAMVVKSYCGLLNLSVGKITENMRMADDFCINITMPLHVSFHKKKSGSYMQDMPMLCVL